MVNGLRTVCNCGLGIREVHNLLRGNKFVCSDDTNVHRRVVNSLDRYTYLRNKIT